jgi:hypothetical protein
MEKSLEAIMEWLRKSGQRANQSKTGISLFFIKDWAST